MSDDQKQIDAIIAILRGSLNHMPLSKSIPDSKLLPNAAQLLRQIKSGDSEPALRQTVAKIQVEHQLPVNDQRCRLIASQVVALGGAKAN
jgi:hypothetical protein